MVTLNGACKIINNCLLFPVFGFHIWDNSHDFLVWYFEVVKLSSLRNQVNMKSGLKGIARSTPTRDM